MIRIDAVPPWDVRLLAPALWSLIKKACSRSFDATPADLVNDAENRDAILWIISKDFRPVAVCFTKRLRAAETGIVNIGVPVAGGSGVREWVQPLRQRIHEYRKAEGAQFIIWAGRRGWARVLGLQPTGRLENGLWLFEDAG